MVPPLSKGRTSLLGYSFQETLSQTCPEVCLPWWCETSVACRPSSVNMQPPWRETLTAFQDVSQSLSLSYTESNSPTIEAMASPTKERELHLDDFLPPWVSMLLPAQARVPPNPSQFLPCLNLCLNHNFNSLTEKHRMSLLHFTFFS